MSANREESVIVAVYRDQAAADAAVHQLTDSGVPTADISVIGKNAAIEAALGSWSIPKREEHGLQVHGRSLGMLVGSALGFGEGFFLFLAPGFGAGAWFGPLAGLIVGGIIGSLYGLIAGHFESLDVSAKYRARLITGQCLVSVTSADGGGVKTRQIVQATHPRELESF